MTSLKSTSTKSTTEANTGRREQCPCFCFLSGAGSASEGTRGSRPRSCDAVVLSARGRRGWAAAPPSLRTHPLPAPPASEHGRARPLPSPLQQLVADLPREPFLKKNVSASPACRPPTANSRSAQSRQCRWLCRGLSLQSPCTLARALHTHRGLPPRGAECARWAGSLHVGACSSAEAVRE